jgi:maltose alpha-D-glucosyltransferase/alpha-amylase
MTHADPPVGDEAGRTLVALVGTEIPDAAIESVGGYLETARALGLRTAEMHLALCSDPSDPNFATEPFSVLYQRSLYQAFRAQAHQALALLRRNLAGLPDGDRAAAAAVLSAEDQIVTCYSRLLDHKIAAARARCHGDFHLGQVLFTGKDYVIIDFEGEPARPLSERRLKRSPLRDVAGMLRSFDYAGVVALRDRLDSATSSFHLERWRQHWTTWVSVAYLNTYLTTVQSGPIAPSNNADLNVLLNVIYELEYELNSRPAWVTVPLQGILSLLNHREP